MGLFGPLIFIIFILLAIGFVFFSMIMGTLLRAWFVLKGWLNGGNTQRTQNSSQRRSYYRNDTSTKQKAEEQTKIFSKDEGEYVDFEEI